MVSKEKYTKKKTPKRPHLKDAQSLADVLPGLCRDIHFDEKAQQMSVLAMWSQLVTPQFKETTQAVSIRQRGGQTILQVVASNPMVASALGFELDTIKQRLNALSPQTGVVLSTIRVLVGS